MLITKQKHLGRDSFWLNTFQGTATVEGVVLWQRHATTSGRYGREEWQTRAANRKRRGGKHGLSSYVGQRVCLRGSGAIVSPAYVEDEKKPTLLLVGIMSLRLQKEANLISYKGHSDVRSERSTGDSDDDGCCWFRAISVGLSLFAHGCVPCQGDSHAGPLIWRCVVDEVDQSLCADFSPPTRPPLTHCIPHQQCLTHAIESEQVNLLTLLFPVCNVALISSPRHQLLILITFHWRTHLFIIPSQAL